MGKKFIKKIAYSKDEIAVTVYYRENPGVEIPRNDASGWVRAATGKDKLSDDPYTLSSWLIR